MKEMSKIFRIKMLPARNGDCFLIQYGDPRNPNKILIDGGTSGTYKDIQSELQKLPSDQHHFELLIVTHVDRDHIEGILALLTNSNNKVKFDDIWFNGWRHLPGSGFEDFGPVQGEKLTTLLIKSDISWNKRFNKKRVVVSKTGTLPSYDLQDGMKLFLLSPGIEQLKTLRPVWKSKCRKAGLDPSIVPKDPTPVPSGFEVLGPPNIEVLSNRPFDCDESETNGSTIAVLAEYEGRRILLAGDGYPNVILESIKRLVGSNEQLKLDAFKLPHHGSKANITRDLLERIDCKRYLFSTNGAYFQHPDKEAIARVIKFGGQKTQLIFNYRTKYNMIWDNKSLMKKYGYSVNYSIDKSGQTIDLL